MNGTILSKLDVSVNKVNRFISTNMSPRKQYGEYEKTFHPIEIVNEAKILEVAEILSKDILPNREYKQSTTSKNFIIMLGKIFSDKKIILGDKKISQSTLKQVYNQLDTVYKNKKILTFTLLGYPHKMPNPLYTNSTSVDLSEVISLVKLYNLMKIISKIYPYGVKLIILTENSIFHKMSDISNEEQMKYFNDLCYWEKLIDKNQLLDVVDIKNYHTKELEEKWSTVETELKHKYEKSDPVIKDKVNSVMPTNFMTLNYREYKLDLLIKYFDINYQNKEVEKLRVINYERALKESFYYLSYHQARYELGFMDAVFPNTFRLTVAPKVGSFAINMLNNKSKILPYYGYIVKKGRDFKMEYIVDVPKKAKSIYWEENLEHPFYYEI